MAFDIIFFFLFNFLFLGDILIFFKQIKKKNKKLIHWFLSNKTTQITL